MTEHLPPAPPAADDSPQPDVALAPLTAALADAETPWEVARAVATRGAGLLGADLVALHAARGARGLEVVLAEAHATGDALVPLGSGAPEEDALVATAARGAAPVWMLDEAELAERFPAPAPRAIAALPLVTGSRSVQGVLALAWTRSPAPDEARRALADVLAARCASALRRALHQERERRARGDAEAALADARRLARLQDHLMAVVGHDLRTPLQTVIMGTRLLQRGELGAAHAGTLARVQRSAERAAGIIRDLLDLGRARKGLGVRIAPREADLGAICRGVVLELQQAHPDRSMACLAAGDARGTWDPERLAQVVANLAGNALLHGGPRARVRVEVDGRHDPVKLAVWNDGAPIPAARLSRLFEPFHGGAPDPADPTPGLGLAIVREIVRAHGGAVSVRSSADDGTTFEVRLPRQAPSR